jgi:drug/metabolite transporter (DMT)-like permease
MMHPFVFAAVLFAAACHAGWNAAIKGAVDTVSATSQIAIGAGAVALVILAVVGMPLAAAWPWVAASVMVHLLYFIGLSERYRVGDLGQVYPIARGAAPLMTAALSAPLLSEALGLLAWIGIVTIAGGVLLLSLRGGQVLARFDRHATALALFTAATVCAYTLIDGVGARIAGSALAYAGSLFIGNAVALALYALARGRKQRLGALTADWRIGLAGGTLQVVSYAIVLWAMTAAPIAIVAALRETSVLFGTGIAVVLLKEQLRPLRIGAALIIVCGLMLLRLS